jgi:endonuclease-3
VATILSAQSTDRMVNRVTPALFAAYPTPQALAAAPPQDVERLVHSTGFFRNKARAIREASRAIVERFGGRVPDAMPELLSLPGVARKTANVVLGTGHGVAEGIVIDVHGIRVSRRLGLTREKDPARIEAALMELAPRRAWIALGHRLTLLGRYTCLARRPRCDACACAPVCPSAEVQ